MVSKNIPCNFCHSDQVVKNGKDTKGTQKYLCRACGKQFREHPHPRQHPPEFRALILKAYQERMSWRGLHRAFGVATKTVLEWLEKKR